MGAKIVPCSRWWAQESGSLIQWRELQDDSKFVQRILDKTRHCEGRAGDFDVSDGLKSNELQSCSVSVCVILNLCKW
jgi:hypothetical protein